MDDRTIARTQARGLATVLEAAGVELDGLWLHYFRLGGDLGVMEVEAYLHHALVLPALQRDLLACACNELAEGHPHRPGTSRGRGRRGRRSASPPFPT